MSASIRLSRKTAQTILDVLALKRGQQLWPEEPCVEALRSALHPKKPWRVQSIAKVKALKKETKRERFSKVRKEVEKRAGGKCEHCGRTFTDWDPPEADHFFGRKHAPETVGTVWLLDLHCHRQKTDNFPSAAFWLRAFLAHCERHEHKPWARVESARAQRRLESLQLADAAEFVGKAATP